MSGQGHAPSLAGDSLARGADAWLLVGELTHRVVNEYSLAISSLATAAARSANAESRRTILNAAERLRAFANAHRALQAPTRSGEVDLAAYLRTVCSSISQAVLEDRQIALTLVEESVALEATRCWLVGLIVWELIVNAVKHGANERVRSITVEITAARDRVWCAVSDNFADQPVFKGGQGTAIVAALAEALGGVIERQLDGGRITTTLCVPRRVGFG